MTPLRTFRSFDRVTNPELPSSTVTDLAQDDRGILWIVTVGGLATFDGRRLQAVPQGGGGPPPGQVRAVQPRRSGGIFVLAPRAIYSYDHRSWRRMETAWDPASLAEGEGGDLWSASTEGVLWRRSSPRGGWTSTPVGQPVLAVKPSTVGGVWIWGDENLFRWTRDRGLVKLHGYPAPPVAGTSAADDSLWMATGAGHIYFTDGTGPGWSAVDAGACGGDRVRRLTEDRRGRIWAALNGGGLCFGSKTSRWSYWGTAQGLTDAGALAVLADREGSLWIGYNGGGLQQWLGEDWSHRSSWHSGPGRRRTGVSSIQATEDGEVVATVFGQGVWLWDGSRMHEVAGDLPQDPASAVTPEPGALWVGTREGIFERRDGGGFRRTLTIPMGIVRGFFLSPEGRWHAVTSGAGIFRRVEDRWEPADELNRKLPDGDVRAMLWRADGDLLVGTLTGLAVFAGDGFRGIPSDSPGMPSSVTDLLELPSGAVWISGIGGIGVLEPGRDVPTPLTTEPPLPGPTIAALDLAPDGSVWISGHGGLARWHDGRLERFGRADGVLDLEGTYGSLRALEDGRVLVGTMSTLTQLDRSRARPETDASLQVFWETPPRRGQATKTREVRLAWTAPWLLPEPVEFRYRVPGLDDGWSPPQRDPSLVLTGPGPGDWEIEVQARIVGEREWTDPIHTTVSFPPRLWETAWARAALLILLALSAYGAHRLRTRVVTRRAALLEEIVEERTASLRSAQEDLRAANQTLEDLARTDGLTGIPNRRSFDTALEAEWRRACRNETELALVLLDIDHFKLYNDSYGHQEGDACLRAVASALKQAASRRAGDVAARYGGEEFVLLLPETGIEGAFQVAEAARSAIERLALPHRSSRTARHVTVSLGVATLTPHPDAGPQDIVRLADQALYQAKEEGRNRVRIAGTGHEHAEPLRVAV